MPPSTFQKRFLFFSSVGIIRLYSCCNSFSCISVYFSSIVSVCTSRFDSRFVTKVEKCPVLKINNKNTIQQIYCSNVKMLSNKNAVNDGRHRQNLFKDYTETMHCEEIDATKHDVRKSTLSTNVYSLYYSSKEIQ